ncbi:SF1B family DNA helicase RecD2, partial [Turicimonas muris]|uniref:SF1B family DNA helicase RecD2 n=2 Tax=Turicimonas muris TaxID=1796652 RepID=UPI002597886F
MQKLTGLVERVTFHSEESGYCVIKIKVKGERELATVVGHTPAVSPGEFVSCSGDWIYNREYGRQFQSVFLNVYPPATKQGIEKYLGSGMVKGIGPTYASRLVKQFGEKVFDIIEQNPERLKEVEGIGPKRFKAIVSGWADQKIIRNIMIFLHSHKVSTAKSVRIFKKYGENAVSIITQNPYILAKDIKGIGFRSADTIALNMGIPKDSILRARAGISYVLSVASSNLGHACLPKDELIKMANELLEMPEQTICDAIEKEIEENSLVSDDHPESECLYLPSLFYSEVGIASSIRRLNQSCVNWPNIDPDKAIAWVEKKLNINLAESQKEAAGKALNSKLMVITGGPGVGKTTLVNSILRILSAKKVKIILCAPTGRAAKRMSETTGCEAKTIHRLLEVSPETGKFQRNREKPLDCDLLVIDECSMVDLSLANSLLQAVPDHASVIFVGDVNQLPSVGPGTFLSDLIECGQITVIKLTEVFRQAADSWIIRAAHQIKTGTFRLFLKKVKKEISNTFPK